MNAPSTYIREVADGRETLSDSIPILSGPDEYPEISVGANGVKPLTTEAEMAFGRLQDACLSVAQSLLLQEREALLIDNRKGLHARGQYPARHDGTDRWLQRTYVRRSMWDIRHRWTGTRRVHW